VKESEEEMDASTKEIVEQVIKEVQQEVEKEREVSRKLVEALDELEREEIESKSAEEKLREALEDLEEHEGESRERSETVFSSMEELERIVQHHQHVERDFTSENYDKCEQYLRVISEEEDATIRELAEREDLDERVVNSWMEGTKPREVLAIERHESKRLAHEAQVPEEALEHRIRPEDVHEATSDALEREFHSVKELTDIVENIHRKMEDPKLGTIHYAELYDSEKKLVEDQLRDIALEIRSNREAIQTELNSRLGLDEMSDHELRIAVTDSRLYYWHVNTSPDEWVNVLADQKLYMSEEGKKELIEDMAKHFHVRGGGQTSEYYLNDIISQLSGLENQAANRVQRYSKSYSLDGEVMHLIGDLQGKSIEDYKDMISHVGVKKAARVSDLRFPEIHKFRMRFVAIAESDCHLDGEGRFSYYEKDIERREIAIDFFKEFGDFIVKLRKDNEIQLDLPRTFGVLAEYWGVPRGDKAIHNKGLHESVIHETPEIKVYYPKEMVPEDGSISGHRVSVRRHNVLHAGKFTEKYRSEFGIEPLVDQRHIEFVIDKGTPQKEQLCYEKGEVIRLYCSDLEKLAEDRGGKYMHLARDLLHIISENKNKLVADERDHIMNSLGVAVKVQENFVQYYPGSQRLSLCSTAVTKTKNDAIRWVLIAPPNHPSKMNAAIALISSDDNRSQQIAKQIEEDGFSIDTVWEGYLN
jgi:hypothetical protein